MIGRIQTDNAWAHRYSLLAVAADLGVVVHEVGDARGGGVREG